MDVNTPKSGVNTPAREGTRINVGWIIGALTLGAGTIAWLPVLPSQTTLLSLLMFALALIAGGKTPLALLGWLGAGFVWGCLNGLWVLAPLQQLQHRQPIVQGTILSPNLRSEQAVAKVLFEVARVDGKFLKKPFRVQLTWQAQQQPYCAGQTWALKVRLRAVHGRLNDGGFDSQRYAVSQGRVLQGVPLTYRPLDERCSLRQRIIDRALDVMPVGDGRAVIVALAFGERGLMSRELKLLMQRHGIAHLMAISGLHISLAALLGWALGRGIQRLFPVRLMTPRMPLLCGAIVAWGYVWLSGENPPALRAGVGYVFCGLLWLLGRNMTLRQRFLGVAVLLILNEPLVLLSESFWLSVTAVACLIAWYWLCPLPARFQQGARYFFLRLLHLQVGIMLLLQPLQIYLFHGISLSALPANLLAVPLVSLLVIPLILCGVLLPISALATYVWTLADSLVNGLMGLLQALPVWWWPINGVRGWAISLFTLAAVWMLWCGWRSLTGAALLATGVILSVIPPAPRPGWRLHMLDVGHGLAVVIERHGRALLYDTGNRWADGDMATLEIIPWLRWHGLMLDGMIISHMHADHSGGVRTLRAAYPGAWLRSSRRGDLPCVRGETWQWQDITFTALWPPVQVDSPGNNDSCVLRLSTEHHRVLLTGDIEKRAEMALVKRSRQILRADLLQVPHHGSGTSSSALFLRTVAPQAAFSSSARYSPWRFPAEKVVERYHNQSSEWHDTPHAGQISAEFSSVGWHIHERRTQLIPRWYHAWFGVEGENE